MLEFIKDITGNVYLISLFAYVTLSLIIGFVIKRYFNKGDNEAQVFRQEVQNVQQGPRLRGLQNRQNVNNRPARNNSENEMTDPVHTEPVSKIGTKKRAKLEAKAERKVQREAEIKHREEAKQQKQEEEKERKLKEEEEKLIEQKKEEEERKKEEEKRRKEEEEYRKMKEAFSVEGEGYNTEEILESDDLLQKFIDYLKENKVVMVEDVAAKFSLKVQTVIERIQQLQADGLITGVIDDRGKFIYITEDELKAVADFVKKRGRVSIPELVENSNNLIVLNEH